MGVKWPFRIELLTGSPLPRESMLLQERRMQRGRLRFARGRKEARLLGTDPSQETRLFAESLQAGIEGWVLRGVDGGRYVFTI